ncbi:MULTISPECIES: aldo/keto reductase [Halomonas]|uniref:aldo/keto reductase n=1 Tax=Halomonas TaxID=2745 RepID=UPI001C93F8A9|nr:MULTISPECIES: aldo/keto reductase [Halomonas]MBY5967121.1 aldo/keto reductase [Halomonas denitrificans]MBY6029405.1 aldo/keto reductase [Halomonas sp. DP8Y7-1]
MSLATVSLGPHDADTLPAIGQGTWFMGEGRAPRSREIAALQRGLERGLRLIDTAEMYADGEAESVVGEALAGRRDQAYVVSKVYPWNASSSGAIAACEASLKRLNTDYLDLYLLHWPGNVPLEETLEAFERLTNAGKIRHFGVSNFDVEDMQALSSVPGSSHCAVNQVLYHLASRGIEVALRPWQRQHRIPLMAYCPLAQAGGVGPDPLRDPELQALAAEHQLSPAQLLLAWAIRPIDGSRDVIAIPKAATPDHVDDNAKALEVTLDEATLARLDELYPAPSTRVPLDIV